MHAAWKFFDMPQSPPASTSASTHATQASSGAFPPPHRLAEQIG